jgi:hypothetical protein
MTPVDPFDKIGIRNNILDAQRQTARNVTTTARKNVRADALDQFSQSFGELSQEAVDDSGVTRFITSPIDIFETFGIHAHFAGFAPDGSPTIWIDADTGVVNLTQVNFNGTTLLESLVQLEQAGWIVLQRVTVGSETRIFRMGMQDNGTYAEGRIEFNEPSATSVTVPNGDFATLDMTDWTQDVGVWDASTGEAVYTKPDGTYAGVDPQIKSTRVAITANSNYSFSAKSYAVIRALSMGTGVGTITVRADFYDASSGGTLIASETIVSRTGATLAISTGSKNVLAPVGATHVEFVALVSVALGYEVTVAKFDDFTIVGVAAETALIFRDNDLVYLPATGKEKSIVDHYARPGRRQGYGVLAAGSATIETIGTRVFNITGSVTTGIRNGNFYRRFTSPATTNYATGINHYGQSTGFFDLSSNPYFSAMVSTPEDAWFQVFIGMANSNPSAGAFGTYYVAFYISGGRWVGKYYKSGVSDVSTGTALPFAVENTDYFLEIWVDSDRNQIKFAVNGIEKTLDVVFERTTLVYPMVNFYPTEAAAKVMDIYSSYLELMGAEAAYDSTICTFASRPDAASGVDTHINSAAPTTNYNTATSISAGTSTTNTFRTLIKFDISSIPATATIISAKLILFVSSDSSTNARIFVVRRLLRNWVLAQATWNIYSTGNNWQTAGGTGANDLDPTNWASLAFTASEAANTEKIFELSPTEFQKMVDGTYPNYGWMIRNTVESSDRYDFYSANNATVIYHPKLVVKYRE